MKLYFLAIILLVVTFNSCGQDLLQTSSETLGSYNINNLNFYINISKINGGATSTDCMQIRRVYNDSTYEIVKNIENGTVVDDDYENTMDFIELSSTVQSRFYDFLDEFGIGDRFATFVDSYREDNHRKKNI